jgi:hypothetical protein
MARHIWQSHPAIAVTDRVKPFCFNDLKIHRAGDPAGTLLATDSAARAFNHPYRRKIMAATHDNERYETLGMLPSAVMVLGGLVVAILPALVQVYLLAAG